MGVYYETIPDSLRPWILAQKMLFVATSPLSASAHINVSPKGGIEFGILSPTSFWYLDLSGSGVETIAHLKEPGNGRICVMFCAFEGPPRIVRLWGKGRVLENGSQEFADFVIARETEVKEGGEKRFEKKPGMRSVIVVDTDQVGGSCGWSVPFYDFKAFRSTLTDHFDKKEKAYERGKEEESMVKYWAWKSSQSVDGLPGMRMGVDFAQKHGVKPLKKFVGQAAPTAPRIAGTGGVEVWQLVASMLLSMVIGFFLAITIVDPEVARMLQEKRLFV